MEEPEKAIGTIVSSLIVECPYCEKEVREDGCDVQDLTGYDFEDENEMECPYCNKTFIAVIE